LRLLPSRVVVYFVLALALFEHCSYRATWGKLVAGLEELALVRPSISSLSRARRRICVAPLRRLRMAVRWGFATRIAATPGRFVRIGVHRDDPVQVRHERGPDQAVGAGRGRPGR
jgi:hypothetical protein